MDVHAELKQDLHKMIDLINDESFLQAVYVILDSKKQEDFYDELHPALQASIERGLDQIKNGQTVPHEEVRKLYSKWLK